LTQTRVVRTLNATSGSPASARATVVAAAIVSEHGGELLVVHVRPPLELRVLGLGPTTVPRAGWMIGIWSLVVLCGASARLGERDRPPGQIDRRAGG
jgi:hypothetical protein